MKRTINFLIFCTLSVLLTYAQVLTVSNTDFTSNELHLRGGLSNFIVKANRGDSLKIAYLGGSITEQDGWRGYSFDWFKGFLPKAKLKEINAAIGGTGSDFGAYRLKEQVLDFSPDLVFIEFCVNDNRVSPERVTRSMEGIVRQIWRHNPAIDICFIYTIMEEYLTDEMNGRLPLSVQVMEKVAEKYSIPSINFGAEVCKRVYDKQLIFTGKSKEENGMMVFSADGIHPYHETGQMIYHETLIRSFKKIVQNTLQQVKPHTLPQPIDATSFVNTQMIGITRLNHEKGWKIVPIQDNALFSEFAKYLQSVGEATPGSRLNFRFKGTSFGAFDLIGPGSGSLEVTVDGNVTDTIMRFDPYCTYWRKHYFIIDQLQDTLHKISIRVLPNLFDKASILSKLNHKKKDSQEYEGYNWYVGKILVEGSFIPPKR